MKLVRWQAGIYTMGICMTRSLHGPETRAWTAVSPGDGIEAVVLQKISLERNEYEDPSCLLSLGCHSTQAGDEGDLTSEVAFGHALHLPLADHAHALIPLERPVCGLE
jgi:hypothetical protein